MPETAQHASATQAARLIGVNERTVRLWIEKGKISAQQLAANRLAIPMSEIERVIRERQQENERIPGPRELARQVADLQAELDTYREQSPALAPDLTERLEAIEQRLERLESFIFGGGLSPARATVASARRPRQREMPEDRALPEGCILLRDFAISHGVNPNTARDHAVLGIGRGEYKDRLEVSERPKPGRASGKADGRAPEMERFLTPEQQEAALAYWQRHGVPYQLNITDTQD